MLDADARHRNQHEDSTSLLAYSLHIQRGTLGRQCAAASEVHGYINYGRDAGTCVRRRHQCYRATIESSSCSSLNSTCSRTNHVFIDTSTLLHFVITDTPPRRGNFEYCAFLQHIGFLMDGFACERLSECDRSALGKVTA